jgi:hypothetical protein
MKKIIEFGGFEMIKCGRKLDLSFFFMMRDEIRVKVVMRKIFLK